MQYSYCLPSLPSSLSGLLIDWLSLLDTDVISDCPHLQQQLLFAKHQSSVTKDVAMETDDASQQRTHSSMPYLLALLTHQARWSSLHKCIHLLLDPQKIDNRYEPGCVLDFLWACLHIPRIWQGRDKKPPKNYKPEDVLHLTTDQIQAVVHYILAEAAEHDTSSTSSQVSAAATEAIDRRILLLMSCCCNRGSLIKSTIDYLHGRLKKDKKDWGLCHHLLMQLYLRVPHITGMREDDMSSLSSDLQATRHGFSQLDSLSHHLLNTLGSCGPGNKTENSMLDANIACRKLAAQYPILMLRQMPLMAALLQGKAQFSFGEIRHRHHLTLYTHILSLLELLQPYIFHPNYNTFENILQSFFELIRNHGLENRQLGAITVKFIQLLTNFMSNDSARASRVLHKYSDILNYLTTRYPEFPALKSVLAGLALPQQECHQGEGESSSSDSADLTITPIRPGSPWTVAQLQPFQNKIQKSASLENMLTVLNDLDDTSKRRVDILDNFLGDLKRLMLHGLAAVRDLAHMLVMRHIRHDPSSSSQFINTFLQCLDSNNQDIVNAALKNLPEFAVLAQEHAVPLLQKAFQVGISSKVDTTGTLTETLQLLNMETIQ